MRLNNYAVDPTNIYVRKQIAFVAQDDSLQVTSTPREAIRFSAKLRLTRETTEHALDTLTERMITELGLTSCADTIVGGALIKGISGGERKRTSVGVELVVVSEILITFVIIRDPPPSLTLRPISVASETCVGLSRRAHEWARQLLGSPAVPGPQKGRERWSKRALYHSPAVFGDLQLL